MYATLVEEPGAKHDGAWHGACSTADPVAVHLPQADGEITTPTSHAGGSAIEKLKLSVSIWVSLTHHELPCRVEVEGVEAVVNSA